MCLLRHAYFISIKIMRERSNMYKAEVVRRTLEMGPFRITVDGSVLIIQVSDPVRRDLKTKHAI